MGTSLPGISQGWNWEKLSLCEALCPQRRVSLDRKGEGGSFLKLLHQTREGHTTNLLWKLATERSPGHPQAGERKRTRVLLRQRQAALPTGWGLVHTSTCRLPCQSASPSVPHPHAALQEQGLAQRLSTAEEGQECIQTGPDCSRVKLGMCFSAQERYLLLPTSFSATIELRNPSVW